MLYPWLDWQRTWLSIGLELSRLGGAAGPLERLLHPPRELVARTLAAGAAGDRPLEEAVRVDAPFPVWAEPAASTPFARLLLLRRPGPQRRRFLVLAPCSGYATAVISPLVTTLVAQGEVIVTEWIDARLVPAAEGGFGLRQQIELGLAAATALGGPAHLVALSQSGPAALALTALLAERAPALLPTSLAFLGCQLDPARSPSPLQQVLARWPRELLEAQLTTVVGRGYPGVGRRVYPALLQLLAYSLVSPQLYAEVQHGLLRELAAGRVGGVFARQHADIHSLADVPAELFVDMVDWMLGAGGWNGAVPTVAGAALDLTALRERPVLTLEAGADELIGRGQTHALARRARLRDVRAVTLPDRRHHELFTGPRFLSGVATLLRRFYAEIDP
jgi:polyhydroxyalkanoate depolymerase